VSAGLGIDIMLALLLVGSIVINCATLDKPLVERKHAPRRSARTYGEIPSSDDQRNSTAQLDE